MKPKIYSFSTKDVTGLDKLYLFGLFVYHRDSSTGGYYDVVVSDQNIDEDLPLVHELMHEPTCSFDYSDDDRFIDVRRCKEIPDASD